MLRAYVALGIGALGLSFSAIFVRWAGAPGAVTGFYRMAIALVILAPFFVRAIRLNGAPPARLAGLAFLAGLFFTGDLAAWNTSVLMTTAANATLLANTAPIWVALGTLLILRRPLSNAFWVGLTLALLGTALISGADFLLRPARAGAGDLLALLAGFFYGGFYLATGEARQPGGGAPGGQGERRERAAPGRGVWGDAARPPTLSGGLRRGLAPSDRGAAGRHPAPRVVGEHSEGASPPPTEGLSSLLTFWIAALASTASLLLLALLLGDPLTGYSAVTYWNFLALGLVSQVAGYLAINYALGHLPAGLVAATLLLQPVLTGLLAIPLLQEGLDGPQLVGGAAVLAGIWVVHERLHPRSLRPGA